MNMNASGQEAGTSEVVLITGCSTGIGRDLAQRLAQSGYTVVATARKVDTLQGLHAALKLPLDVTQPESIRQAVECTLERFGRIDVLVNNAGYAVCGTVEEISVEQVERMFAANVFGAMRMIQAVAPHMRRQRAGRIINVSSIAGKLSTPVNGAYSASKFALEALSDAARLELESFGVQVVLVEPGSIKTNFDATVQANTQALYSNPASAYQPLYRQHLQTSTEMRRGEPGPEAVSRVIQQAIETKKPKARYLAGISTSVRLVIYWRDAIWDFIVRYMYKL